MMNQSVLDNPEARSPWIVTRDIDFKQTDKVIDGTDPFYLFVYITMAGINRKPGDPMSDVFINFEFFPGKIVIENIDFKVDNIAVANNFINIHGMNIGDKVVQIVKYFYNESIGDFGYEMIYNDEMMLDVVKDVYRNAVREGLEDKMHTVMYKATIDIKLMKQSQK